MAHKVDFRKSGIVAEWEDRFESILELAEEHGVEIDYECRQGYCGTCAVRLISGNVEMEEDVGLEQLDDPEGMILACTAIPTTDVVIDA